MSQIDNVLVEGEIIESDNEYVQLGNENVPIDNDNVGIENLENENLENEMLPDHNINCTSTMSNMTMHMNLTYLLIIIDMTVLGHQNG